MAFNLSGDALSNTTVSPPQNSEKRTWRKSWTSKRRNTISKESFVSTKEPPSPGNIPGTSTPTGIILIPSPPSGLPPPPPSSLSVSPNTSVNSPEVAIKMKQEVAAFEREQMAQENKLLKETIKQERKLHKDDVEQLVAQHEQELLSEIEKYKRLQEEFEQYVQSNALDGKPSAPGKGKLETLKKEKTSTEALLERKKEIALEKKSKRKSQSKPRSEVTTVVKARQNPSVIRKMSRAMSRDRSNLITRNNPIPDTNTKNVSTRINLSNNVLKSDLWSRSRLSTFIEKHRLDRIRHSYDDLESSEAEYDVTWPRFSEYEESNNSIELESCTKEQLLNLLITPENSPLLAIWDYTSFLMNFLIVYESFFSTEELMHHLVNKYNDVVPTIDGYDIRLRNTLKKLVVEWISVEKAIETKTTVEKLFVDYTKNNHNTFSIDFEKYELRGKSKLYVATEPVDSDVFETETIEPPQKKNYVVLDFNPVEVARQLSLCEASLYNKIPRIEMLNGKIFSKNKELLAPNFVAMVEHSNRICSWIKTEILRLPNPKLRSEAVVFFINVIVGLEQYRNFNSLVSALSALHSSTITKLKKTWELVPKKEKEILDYITDLMSSSHHYKCYRQMLSNVADEYPTIPLLSLVASDIFGIEENIPTYEENTTDYLKWRKTRLMAKVILNFKRFTPVNYPFKEVLPIQNYIANCESWQNDNIAYELASLLEGEELGDKELDYLNTDDLWEKYGPLDRDWSVVLAGSRTVTFEKGSIIIDEGASISHVYRVNVGRVSITRNGEKVGTITEGQIFGETTFIFHRKVESPDRFIAETDVEVQQIPEEFIAHMCKEKPELEARFQIEFARTLAKQLRMISAFRMVPKLQLGNIMEENTAPNKDVNHFNVDVSTSDKKLCKRFGIENEVVLQAFSCDWKKGNKSQGIDGVVYVFQNYICFYSSSFGLQTKDVIPFTSVTDITQGKKDVDINITTTQTSINCSNFQKKMSQIYELLRSVWVAKAQNSDKPIASPDPAIEKPKLMEKKKLAIPNHEDWSLILKGSVMLTFPENHYIIKEGERVCRLYQIQSGSCKVVQRQQPDQVLATINSEDKILGERCFLDGGKATASVITTQPTKVIAIEAYFLNFLLQIKPDLVGRFFHYVSTLLARGYLKKRFLI